MGAGLGVRRRIARGADRCLGTIATAYDIGYVLSNLGGCFLVDWVGGRAVIGASGVGAGTGMILFGATTSVPVGLAVQAGIGCWPVWPSPPA